MGRTMYGRNRICLCMLRRSDGRFCGWAIQQMNDGASCPCEGESLSDNRGSTLGSLPSGRLSGAFKQKKHKVHRPYQQCRRDGSCSQIPLQPTYAQSMRINLRLIPYVCVSLGYLEMIKVFLSCQCRFKHKDKMRYAEALGPSLVKGEKRKTKNKIRLSKSTSPSACHCCSSPGFWQMSLLTLWPSSAD